MNRVKKIAMQLVDKYPDIFGIDYNANKEALDRVAIFRSKELKNKVAGYITNHMRNSSD